MENVTVQKVNVCFIEDILMVENKSTIYTGLFFKQSINTIIILL